MISREGVDEAIAHATARFDALVRWVDDNGWSGWDPYDVWDNRLGTWAMSRTSLASRAVGAVIGQMEQAAPLAIRRLVGARPRINAKAMGLFASAYLRFGAAVEAAEREPFEARWTACFEWLEQNRVRLGRGCGWGYPFDWRTRVLIPRGTPTIVNSAIIGDAYWKRWKMLEDEEALARCEEICEFIAGSLNRSAPRSDGTFCFSYTPRDHFEVHNANLLGAEFLTRVGVETGRSELVDLGVRAGRWSLHELRPDGTLFYWSHAQTGGTPTQDTYHSGFEIRALAGIARNTSLPEFRVASEGYFQTWLRDFFGADGTPAFIRGDFAAIEVHSCAEALLCAVDMHEQGSMKSSGFIRHVTRVLRAADRLWCPSRNRGGFYAWQQTTRYGFPITSRIAHIRWGQAWMTNALARTILSLRSADCGEPAPRIG